MKKLVLAVVLALGFTGANAQELQIIPKIGVNLSNQAINSTNGEKFKVGYQGGVGLNISTLMKNFSFQPEINFVNKGTTIEVGSHKEKYNFNYLEVPVLAKYSFGMFYVNAGPSVGYLVGKDKKLEATYGDLKKINLEVQMGGGVAIPAGPGKVIVDARYGLGLNNISDVSGTNVKNRSILLSVGYAINLK
jgi:hypothetical protein